MIELTRVPDAGEGDPNKLAPIEGRVSQAPPGSRIVLYAKSSVWWVQPFQDNPFTAISPGGTWKSDTHPGTDYAALLVAPGYEPPGTIPTLPEAGGLVLAALAVKGKGELHSAPTTLNFSGYEWNIRYRPSNFGGTQSRYDPRNAWTDSEGLLHLRIARHGAEWTNAEVSLPRSLGYGSYRFLVRGLSHLEPAAVFAMSTFDIDNPTRGMDIEISRWAESTGKNAQYVIQPYHVPANIVRFVNPAGPLTYWLRWEPGRASFETARGSALPRKADPVAEHVFTSGVPAPGHESVHIKFCVFYGKSNPLQHDSEVLVEKFEYLP